MATKYDRIYYWSGGTERGEWRECTPGVWPEYKDIDTTLAEIKRQGYIAFKGLASIGPPEGNPHQR